MGVCLLKLSLLAQTGSNLDVAHDFVSHIFLPKTRVSILRRCVYFCLFVIINMNKYKNWEGIRMPETGNVLLEKSNGIATITMNRLEALNSLHPVMVEKLVERLREMENDPGVKVVILTGAGKAFCAGGDLPYLEKLDNPVAGRDYIVLAGKLNTAIKNLPKPVIAMVNGGAAGAGFNLALACDLIFCAKSARFAQSFAKIGLIPDCGGHYFLPRAVGIHKAKELMFTADLIDATTAQNLGFVNQVVEDENLQEATFQFAQKLAAAAPIALSFIKKILNQGSELSLEGILELEASLQSVCLQTKDNKEGIKAFKEKRKPVFTGL